MKNLLLILCILFILFYFSCENYNNGSYVQKNIYELKMNEYITKKLVVKGGYIEVTILKVPNGWIYIFNASSIFVPFNDEINQ